MSVEAFKEAARTHEQKEEWDKALGQYKKAIEQLDKAGEPDIGLYNRVADLQVRQGQIEDAVNHYEKAIDLYMEADLPNNAIAVCKKIVRNMPMRHSVYLRMGQIRGKQGLIADSRQNFLTYAERMQAEGNIDEGLRALSEFADFAPEDVDIRLAIAAQMKGHGRNDDAIAQLRTGYRQASLKGVPTAPFEAMLEELGADPVEAPQAADAPVAPSADEEESAEVEVGGFEISIGGGEAEEKPEEEAAEDDTPLPTFDLGSGEEADALPMLGVDDGEEGDALPMLGGDDEEGGDALPMLGGGEDEEAGEPLPMFDLGGETKEAPAFDASAFGESDKDEREAPDTDALPELEIPISLEGPPAKRERAMEEAKAERPAPSAPAPSPTPTSGGAAALPARPAPMPVTDPMGHASLAGSGDLAGAMSALRILIKNTPNDVTLREKMVEYATKAGDAKALVSVQVELGEALERAHQSARAREVFQQVLASDPKNARALQGIGQGPKAGGAKPASDFVDLGSLLFDDEEEKTTRFVVAYEEPSGDDQADFAKMLSQFKAKVAENLSADDVKAHQDLGTAYKEMGLIDEAISEYQQALRASANHLPSYELLGQCFMEKGMPEAAVRTLTRALSAPFEVEDELLGIYYWLGRAHELVGNKPQAVEFYDRVFSLDINFADVTERLRALR